MVFVFFADGFSPKNGFELRTLTTDNDDLILFSKKMAVQTFIFVFSIQLTVNIQYIFLPMTGFERQTSGIGSDHSTNWATTTALQQLFTLINYSKSCWNSSSSNETSVTVFLKFKQPNFSKSCPKLDTAIITEIIKLFYIGSPKNCHIFSYFCANFYWDL